MASLAQSTVFYESLRASLVDNEPSPTHFKNIYKRIKEHYLKRGTFGQLIVNKIRLFISNSATLRTVHTQ